MVFTDDLQRTDGTPQLYDALILHADDDTPFVQNMIQKLKSDYGLNVCYSLQKFVTRLIGIHTVL